MTSNPTKSSNNTKIRLKYVFRTAVLWILFSFSILTAPACYKQKNLSLPASVIDACPYEHLPIPPGPITEETVNNLVANHDLDHKCIRHLKDLLGRKGAK